VDTWNNGPDGTDELLKVIVDGSVVYLNDLLRRRASSVSSRRSTEPP